MAKRILVVDDEQDIAEILQFNLQSEGYDVDVAFSAEEALPKIKANAYDLLLLDVMMGEISGFGLARLLKKDEATADIPIIFITALDGEMETVKGLDLGADDYIAKPLSMKEVMARVRAVLRRTQRRQEISLATIKEVENPTVCYEGIVIDLYTKTATVKRDANRADAFGVRVAGILHAPPKPRVLARRTHQSPLAEGHFCYGADGGLNITRLRKKIEPYGERIKTKIGYGYYFEG